MTFDTIRPFYDTEVAEVLKQIENHPMLKALLHFTFPDENEQQWAERLSKMNSIFDFQTQFIYHSVQKILQNTSEGLSTSGFETLDKNTPYLFISNHRDILLDTSLLNVSLYDNQQIMTASAIGDNLVQKPFLLTLSKLNRNFVVQRNLPPRELLQSSKTMSEYMYHLLKNENRSVWIAQREGRTKDGNDATHQGVLKMIAMASDETNLMDYFKKLHIVPVSISYEYDPTDALKMPMLLAQANDEVYIKEKDEDFKTLMSGIMGQKKRIHIHIGTVLNTELSTIAAEFDNTNKQIQATTQAIDYQIIKNYKLWATNYIAYDLLFDTRQFQDKYTEKEKQLFERRLEMRIDNSNPTLREGFLAMYANPVVNFLKLGNQ